MSDSLESQHTNVVEQLEAHFSPLLDREEVRWDTILVEEEQPSQHLDIEATLDREVDIALVNGTEAYVLEVKTTDNDIKKAEDQVDEIVDFFSEAGYDVWGNYLLEERNEHMDSEELAQKIHSFFGGVFSKDDLSGIIHYQNSWGSFGYIKSSVSRDLTDVDPYRSFHVDSSPYDLEVLGERGVMASDDGDVYRFTSDYQDLIDNGEPDFRFMLEPRAYEKFDLNSS